MRPRCGVASVLVLFMLVVALGCSKSEPPKPAAPAPASSVAGEGKALFEQKCGVCHGLDRATARKESKDKWIAIVKDMQGKRVGWISDAEANKIVEFLTTEHGEK